MNNYSIGISWAKFFSFDSVSPKYSIFEQKMEGTLIPFDETTESLFYYISRYFGANRFRFGGQIGIVGGVESTFLDCYYMFKNLKEFWSNISTFADLANQQTFNKIFGIPASDTVLTDKQINDQNKYLQGISASKSNLQGFDIEKSLIDMRVGFKAILDKARTMFMPIMEDPETIYITEIGNQ